MDKNTPQFKVGDIVKTLPRIGSQEDYSPQYVDDMLRYAGRLATITRVTPRSCLIDIDNNCYYWPYNALQLITSETDQTVDPNKLKNGDYIKLTSTTCGGTLIYLFREVKNNIIYRHAAYSLTNKSINVNPNARWFISSTTKITYATEEEKKLLDKALLEQGYIWNNLTKQLESIGLVNVCLNDFSVQPVDVSSFRNSIQRINAVTNLPSGTKEESQTETELNLFPKKKHYKLNFNY